MEKIVTFPGLGLEFQLNSILVSITEDFGIHWYGAIIAVGFLLAVFWCCRQSSRFGIKQDDLIDMLFFAVPLGIIGARLYYVFFEFSKRYYVEGDPGETLRRIVRIWDGGLAIYGGVIVGVLTAFVVSKVKKISFPALADLCCMGLLIGQTAGRWGNFVNVEAFGSVTDVPWRMAGPNVANYLLNNSLVNADAYEQIVSSGTLGVHPTFFYESVWNLIGFLIIALVIAHRRKFDGQMFLTYVAWYGIGRFWIEGLRTDSLYVLGTGLRVSQLLAGTSALIALGIMVYAFWRLQKTGLKPLYVDRIQKKETTENDGEDS